MTASAMRTYISRYAATPAKRIALFTNNDDGWKTVEAALAAGLAVAAVVDARADVSAAQRDTGQRAPASPFSTARSTGVDGGKDGIGSISVALAGGARATVEADGLAVSGGWNPASALTSYHRGRPKWRDDIAAFVPDGAAARHASPPAPPTAPSALPPALPTATPPAPRPRPISALRTSAGKAASAADDEAYAAVAALACRRQGQGLRRLPERRHRVRHRAGGARGLPVGRAPEALHHARHGDRPGQDLQRRRPRHHGGGHRPLHSRNRHHHLPAALCAGRHRRARRPPPRRAFPRHAR